MFTARYTATDQSADLYSPSYGASQWCIWWRLTVSSVAIRSGMVNGDCLFMYVFAGRSPKVLALPYRVAVCVGYAICIHHRSVSSVKTILGRDKSHVSSFDRTATHEASSPARRNAVAISRSYDIYPF